MANNEVRAELLAQWMRESSEAPFNLLGIPLCEIRWDRWCSGYATDGHERVLRSRGGSPIDRKNVLLTCRRCHDQVHANPKEATERGFMASNTKEHTNGI